MKENIPMQVVGVDFLQEYGEGWKDDFEIHWFSEGYVESKKIVAREDAMGFASIVHHKSSLPHKRGFCLESGSLFSVLPKVRVSGKRTWESGLNVV